jgi:aminoglycoside/choline kinase family phosphotransferase
MSGVVARDEQEPSGAREWIERQRGPLKALEAMPGGAGARRYWRARLQDGHSAVLMLARAEDPRILPPALRGLAPERTFLAVRELLEQRSIPVPELYAVEPSGPWILLEDLGDVRLCDLEDAARAARHAEAIGLLARIHAIEAPSGAELPLPFRRAFDEEWVAFELRLFLDQPLEADTREALGDGFRTLAGHIAGLPRVLCARDYQSQNLMIDGRGRLRLLDFQDAFLAPAVLDLAALLHDSYVEIDAPQRRALLDRYAERSGCAVEPASFAALTVQRKCKDFSRYRFLVYEKRDLRFAPFESRARDAVLGALADLPPGLRGLAAPLRAAFEELRA